MISKLLTSFAEREQFRSGPAGFLRPIDVDRIAKELDLERAAGDNGSNGLPESSAHVPDSIEQAIIQRVEGEWSHECGVFVNELRSYADRLTGYAVSSEFDRLELKARDTVANLRSAHHIAEQDLGHLIKSYRDAKSEFDDFRTRNHLRRPARSGPGRWISIGILCLLLSIESSFNGVFFAKGSDFGLIGGFGAAVGISVVNVISSFLLGWGPARWLHHRSLALRALGLASVVVGAMMLVFLHAFAAHYRDAIAAVGEEQAMQSALVQLLSRPWEVASLNSAYLVGLGLLFSLAAFAKGYQFDDPYPGYGAQRRRLEAARMAYADKHADLFDDLEEMKSETVSELDGGIRRLPTMPQKSAAIRAQREAMIEAFRAYSDSVETAAQALLTRYRDANRKARTEPPPAHFDTKWQLPHAILESAQVKTLTAEAEHREIDIERALGELKRLSVEVLDVYEGLVKSYPHTDTVG